MRSPSPSGYCGATRSTRQSGRTYAAANSSAATATRTRDDRSMTASRRRGGRVTPSRPARLFRRVVGELRARSARGDPDVPLHLLVERRAEVGAVEGEETD